MTDQPAEPPFAALPGVAMCMVILHYDDHAAAEAAMPAHLAWMTEGYASGTLLATGRREPWTGGVILARGDATAVEALMARQPFVTGGFARAEVIPFTLGLAAPGLAALLG